MMKIGVALSGCDVGGISAYHVLKLLEDKGFRIEMISCCGVSAVTALLYGSGEDSRAEKVAAAFLEEAQNENPDGAIAAASDLIPARLLAANQRIAVNSVHVADGKVVTFTNAFTQDTERLQTWPLADAYDTLSATISPLDGLKSYHLGSYRLCDYAVWYGCPFYPLKMSGISRIVSISFLPESPETPYEVMARRNTEFTAKVAEIHIPIEFPRGNASTEHIVEIAASKLETHMDEITWKTLYSTR